MSPKNLQSLEENLFSVLPLAPKKTIKGKTKITIKESYKPFAQRCSFPPILGMANATISNTLQIVNEFFRLINLLVLKSNNPAKNGYKTREIPVCNCSGSSDHPPIISPFGLVTAR